MMEWVAYPFFSGSSWPRNRTVVSCIAGGFFTNWAIMVSPPSSPAFSLSQHQGLFKWLSSSHHFFGAQLSLWSNTHIHTWLLKKPQLWLWTFVGKVMSLLFNMLSRLVIAFLPRSKRLLISWLQSPSAVILEPKKIKYVTISIVSPSICHEVMGPHAMILIFWKCLSQLFHSPLSLSSRGFFSW